MVEELDDAIVIGDSRWGVLKKWAMKPNYRKQSWYAALSDEDKEKLETLRSREPMLEEEGESVIDAERQLRGATREKWKLSTRALLGLYNYKVWCYV